MTDRIRSTASLLFLSLLLAGCGDREIKSVRLPRPIEIDGTRADWAGIVTYLERETMTAMRFANDDDHLYILLTSTDRSMQQRVLAAGLTVWFDPDGGDDEVFGIAYPRKGAMALAEMPGMDGTAFPGGRGDGGYPGGEGLGGDETGTERGKMMEKLLRERRSELDILGPARNACLLATVDEAAADFGIGAMLGVEQRVLVCELRIPLRRNDGSPYVIGLSPGEFVGVTIETGEPSRPAGGPPGGMGGRGGGRGGRGGGMGGGRGGGMGDGRGMGGNRERPQPFTFHAKLLLAGETGDATAEKR